MRIEILITTLYGNYYVFIETPQRFYYSLQIQGALLQV